VIKISDDIEDIFDIFKRIFSLNSDLFDVDFFIFPDHSKDLENENEKLKDFKISYRFGTGMEQPEIKIEGNVNEEEFSDFFNKLNFRNFLHRDRFKKIRDPTFVDAKDLTFGPYIQENDSGFKEPHAEINDFENFSEIFIEVPGIEKEDVNILFNEEGNELTFIAEKANRKYIKHINLPFKSSNYNYDLEINNGIALLRVKKDI